VRKGDIVKVYPESGLVANPVYKYKGMTAVIERTVRPVPKKEGVYYVLQDMDGNTLTSEKGIEYGFYEKWLR